MSTGTGGGSSSGSAGLFGDSANEAGTNVRGATDSSSTDTSGGGSAASIAATFFETGFGMAALVKGLVGLFGGGSSDTPAPLEKYQMPSAISFESAEFGGKMSALDYDQMGQPRSVSTDTQTAGGGVSGAPGPQVTVNVQAMDAQSFLDHSSAIADAVRGAMLNMSSINDVVNEL